MDSFIISSKRKYHHLTQEEREILAVHYYLRESLENIGKTLGRHKSTLCRELKRNSDITEKRHYSPSFAQKQYRARVSRAHQKMPLKCIEIQTYVERHLKEGWSPEIIAGRLPLDEPGLNTNYESIYQYIYKRKPSWIASLARAHRKRRKRGASGAKKSRIPYRVGIEERPLKINQRVEPGHWEADTMVSHQSKTTLQVLIERKCRYVKLSRLPNRTSREMRKQINYTLGSFPRDLVKSITFDNGFENAEHFLVNQNFNSQSYFCHAYSSWEKGSVEQVIGLIRRYYPKKTDFSKLTRYDIKKVEQLLNDRPRKCLGFLSPREMLAVALTS